MPFKLANINGRAALVANDHYFDLEEASDGDFSADPMAAIARFNELADINLASARANGKITDVILGPPVPRPGQIFGIGLNYRSHTAEFAVDEPEWPLIFTKFPGSLAGPTSEIVLRGDQVDWEVELVAVIGKTTKDVPCNKAWDHVAGLMVGQDISDRKVQFSGTAPQFSIGKSFDTYAPTGPFLVSKDGVDDHTNLAISCDVSGERKQTARTDQMIFSIPRLVEYISSIVTMQAGDMIFTGTPEGVGMASGRFLKGGDIIVSSIEGIGTMVNHCVRERR